MKIPMEDAKKKYADIAVQYSLPENWENETLFSFDHLSNLVTQLHNSAYTASVKAVNRFATVRNYVIGFYIIEYEQHGSDRAKYGDKLLKRLTESINKRGINETLLKISRAFYLNYPHIKSYLEGKSATPSHQFITPAEQIISQLSFPTIGFTHQLCRITVGIIMKEIIQVCITASKRQTTLPHMIVVGEHYTLVE